VYVPHHFAVDDGAEIAALVDRVGAAELVTVGRDGYPMATLLPVIWLPAENRVVTHMARANPHWGQLVPDSPGLLVVTAEQAYVSPAWYPATLEHGRVVPTWNYSSVHLTGTVTVHHEAAWLGQAVTLLTRRHEGRRQAAGRPDPWQVDDAPAGFVAGQLKAIVGIEVAVVRVEAKAKLSQNRSPADRAGVRDGLLREGGPEERAVAGLMPG
jgi:transcriptional regulator